MEATSIDGLVAHCQSGRFTGILRVRAREGIGEVWFLSGMTDEMHFGVSTGDEALERMRKATEATYELIARLPHPAGGFKKRFPTKGSIATATPVTLMRYCEQYALTCTLAVESHDVLVEVKYELGELISVETTASDDGITAMLEAQEGTYEFTLPRVELPAGTPVLPPAPSLESIPPPSMPPPESLGFRALLEAKPPVGRPASDEAAVKRKTVEIARQQKAAAASPKPAKTTPTPTPTATPTPSPTAAAEPKAKPKAVAVPRVERKREEKPAKAPEPEKVEAKPVAAPEPVKPEPAPGKEEAKPAEAKPAEAKPAEAKPAEAKPEEAKPAAAAVVEEKRDEEKEEPEPLAKPSPPPAKRSSLTWVVVTLLLAVLGYFWWTASKL